MNSVVRLAAYHMALIEYAKPFRKSRGINNRRHVLSLPTLPDADKQLHATLLDLRDTVLAHSDLTVKGAKVYVAHVSGHAIPMIVSNTRPSLPDTAVVRVHIERVLDELYRQLPSYESQYR